MNAHKKNEILLFYFPFNIAIIDDDEDFLNLISDNIIRKNISKYTLPEKAISDINPFNFKISDLIIESNFKIYDLDYSNIKRYFYDKQMHHGIVISDYRMPKMDGIELLSRFNENDLIKILLTGEFKIENAVKALNEKIIDYYIEKDTLSSLENIISELEIQLFRKITKEINKIIEKDSLFFLEDKIFIELFNKILMENNILKYHIINGYGWYFLENEKDRFILNIFHKKDLNLISEGYPSTEKEKIKKGQLIPSYFSKPNDKNNLVPSEKHGNYSFCIEKIS